MNRGTASSVVGSWELGVGTWEGRCSVPCSFSFEHKSENFDLIGPSILLSRFWLIQFLWLNKLRFQLEWLFFFFFFFLNKLVGNIIIAVDGGI